MMRKCCFICLKFLLLFYGFNLSAEDNVEPYEIEETPLAIALLNRLSSPTEQMRNIKTYKKFRHKDSRLLSWNGLAKRYKQKYRTTKGMAHFIFLDRYYALEEIPSVIVRLNAKSSEAEQIRTVKTYEKFRRKDKRLPSWYQLVKRYKEQNGYETGMGLAHFIFGNDPYALEDVPSAVERLNAVSSKEEQIATIKTYKKFSFKDRHLPSWSSLAIQYKKTHRRKTGLAHFIFRRNCEQQMTAGN